MTIIYKAFDYADKREKGLSGTLGPVSRAPCEKDELRTHAHTDTTLVNNRNTQPLG